MRNKKKYKKDGLVWKTQRTDSSFLDATIRLLMPARIFHNILTRGFYRKMPIVVNGQVIRASECTIAGFRIKEDEDGATLCATAPSRTNARAVAATTRAREKRLRVADAAHVQADVIDGVDESATIADALGAVVKQHQAAVAELDKPAQAAVTTFFVGLKRGERVCLWDSVVEFVPNVTFELHDSMLSLSSTVHGVQCSTSCLAAAQGYVYASDREFSYYLYRFNEDLRREKEVLLDFKLVKIAIGYRSSGSAFDLYVLGTTTHQRGRARVILCRMTPDCVIQQQLDLSADTLGLRADHIKHMAALDTEVFLTMRDTENSYKIMSYGRDLVERRESKRPGHIQALAGLVVCLYMLMDDQRLLGFQANDLDKTLYTQVVPATWLIPASRGLLLAGSSNAIYVLDFALTMLCELKEGVPQDGLFASTCGNVYVAARREVQVFSWSQVAQIVNRDETRCSARDIAVWPTVQNKNLVLFSNIKR